MKKIFNFFLGLLLSVVFIWLLSKNLNLQKLLNNFEQANLFFILLSIIFFHIGYACRIERWRIMLIQKNPELKWNKCSGPFMASVAFNNILPFRAGDFLRAFAFNRRLNIKISTSLASIIIERLLDLLMVLCIFFFGLIYFGMESSILIGISRGIIIILITVIFFVLCSPFFFKRPLLTIVNILFFFNIKLRIKFTKLVVKIFVILEYFSKKKILLKLLFWSFIAWLSEGFVFWTIAISIPEISNHLASWIALPVGSLSTLIPSSPGFIGTFDYFTANSMFLMNNTYSSSVAFAFIVHFVLWLPPVIIGGIYFLKNPINLKIKNLIKK